MRPLSASMGQQRLLDPAPRRHNPLDVLDYGIALDQPGVGLGHEALERAASPHAAPDRMMELRLTGERPDERFGLARCHALEVRHGGQGTAGLAPDALQRGCRELLWDPRHSFSDGCAFAFCNAFLELHPYHFSQFVRFNMWAEPRCSSHFNHQLDIFPHSVGK